MFENFSRWTDEHYVQFFFVKLAIAMTIAIVGIALQV